MNLSVSIIMATYNGERYVAEQIESILKQDYKPFELIIIDDCSVDKTVEIVKNYIRRNVNIVLLKNDSNIGVVRTIEKGLAIARGDYIALSDQDDIWDSNKISTMIGYMNAHVDRDLVYSDLRLINQHGERIADSFWKYQGITARNGRPFNAIIYDNFITGCSLMFRRRILDYALPFPANCIMHDWWLGVVASSARCGGVLCINRPLISYRQHESNLVGATKKRLFGLLGSGKTVYKEWVNNELGRLCGYLERRNLFSRDEMQSINSLYHVYDMMANNRIVARYMSMGTHLKFAASKGLLHSAKTAFITIAPNVYDLMKRMNCLKRNG